MECPVAHQMLVWVDKLPQEILLQITQHLDVLDTKSLMLTCRAFGTRLGRILVERDVKEGTYDSLFWACSWGNVELAKACLDAGASPNVAFCHSPRNVHTFRGMLEQERFEEPVFPSRFRRGKWLKSEDYACSALNLATKMNHLGVMEVLLGLRKQAPTARKAEVTELVERRYNSPDYGYRLPTNEVRSWAAHHSVAHSHVRSAEAAKLLLTAGEMDCNNHTNTVGNLGLTPLVLFLLRCGHTIKRKEPKSKHYKEKPTPCSTRLPGAIAPPEMDEAVMEDIVKLFLSAGANPRAVNQSVWVDDALFGMPIFAAINTMRPELINLILQNGPMDFDNFDSECSRAFSLALGDERLGTWISRLWRANAGEKGWSDQLLKPFLENGVSPNTAIGGVIRPLSLVMGNRLWACFETLLEWKADTEFTDQHNFTPLAMSLIANADQHFFALLDSGVDVNKPSLHDGGFTPLMFAAADHVAPSKFARLLGEGSERGRTGRLRPGSRAFSVLQCLLIGFPPPTSAADEVPSFHHSLKKLDACHHKPRPFEDLLPFQPQRKQKLESFIYLSLDPSHFYSQGGKHVINWAIENLFHNYLLTAINLLAPHYASTKLPNDHENPLATFFSQARADGYLTFGTMYRACKALSVMLEYNFHKMEGGNPNTILQLVSKLTIKGFRDDDGRGWERVMATYDADEQLKRELFSNMQLDMKTVPQAAFIPGDFPRIRLEYIGKSKNVSDSRRRRIGKMMNMLLQKGANLYAEDADGKTPYEYALESRIITFIDKSFRDARSERRLSHKQNSGNQIQS